MTFPDYVAAHALVAWCHERCFAISDTRYEEAASFWARAVQSSPKTGTYYMLQALALALAGRVEEDAVLGEELGL